jgi:hypothetical protein
MCKELLVNLVNRVVDKKRIIAKIEGQGGDPPSQKEVASQMDKKHFKN